MNLGDLIRKARFMGSGTAPEITTVSEPVEVVREQVKSEEADEIAQNVSLLAAEPVSDETPALATSEATVTPRLKLVETPSTSIDTASIPVEAFADGIVITIGDRHYRIRGMEKNTSWERLAVNLTVWRAADPLTRHQANVDLCDGEKRPKLIKAAAAELGVSEDVIKRDLNRIHLKLEELQKEQIERATKPKDEEVVLSAAEEAESMELLTAPNLIVRIREAFRRLGIVGEETNLIVIFLVVISRLLRKPLGVIVQSSSAAGKTTLLDAVLSCTPAEAFLRYSALTAQALFYLTNVSLRHKVLCIREEKGARGATEPLKLLLSDGELTIASTGKDPMTGKLIAHEYRVEGPDALLTTSTAVEVDEELENRCITLAIDESREQTQRIHRQQR